MPRMREAVSIVCEARGRLTLPEGLKAAMPGAFRGNPGGRMTASRIDAVPLPLASAGLSARAGVSVRPRPLPLSAASCGREGMAGAVLPSRKSAGRLKDASALPALPRASLPSGAVCRPSLLYPRRLGRLSEFAPVRVCARGVTAVQCARFLMNAGFCACPVAVVSARRIERPLLHQAAAYPGALCRLVVRGRPRRRRHGRTLGTLCRHLARRIEGCPLPPREPCACRCAVCCRHAVTLPEGRNAHRSGISVSSVGISVCCRSGVTARRKKINAAQCRLRCCFLRDFRRAE